MEVADMGDRGLERRTFLKALLGGLPLIAFNWDSFPRGGGEARAADEWDAIIVGSGLGGLSCAAAFARQGFRPLVLEQHHTAGGYATTFRRPGGFEFDVSLHSTTIGERDGVYNLIPGLPEIQDIRFVPHKPLYRAIFPEHDIRVPHRDPDAFKRTLIELFPDEAVGIEGLFKSIAGLSNDIGRYTAASGQVDMSKFPIAFPDLFQNYNRTWGQLQDQHLKDPRVKGIVSSQWGYYGLPPSKLACIYYALPFWGYLSQGGYYPIGRSQTISDALVHFIEAHGGQVLRGARVSQIAVAEGAARSVRLTDGREFVGRAIVANANVPDVFHKLLGPNDCPPEYLARIDSLQVSLSSFQVFLGLKEDIVEKSGVRDTEVFYSTGYDTEEAYAAALRADVEQGGIGVTLYDNLFPGYSPKGKNTLSIITLQGYDPWQPYEADYFKGEKRAYRVEKERLADIMIDQVEAKLLPGLRAAIEVREVATPLTNQRFTKNPRGAIYGWDQTLNNSGPQRLPHRTAVKNLYLAGAWTRPGHGYGAVVPSGLECFAAVMEDWKG
jgi:all-trans-retinol 13,14-reductase